MSTTPGARPSASDPVLDALMRLQQAAHFIDSAPSEREQFDLVKAVEDMGKAIYAALAPPAAVPDEVRRLSEALEIHDCAVRDLASAEAASDMAREAIHETSDIGEIMRSVGAREAVIRCGSALDIARERLIAVARTLIATAPPSGRAGDASDSLGNYLARQMAWSKAAFADRSSAKGLTKHIEKECAEIRANPRDLVEWIDVVMLALDGYWRHGGTPADVMATLEGKLAKNMAREWPVSANPDEPNEHDRSDDVTPPASAGAVPKGWHLVPAEPTEEMWSGLARQIVMWHRAARPTGANLFRDLKSCGWPIPAWLKEEIEDADYVPPKGAVAVAIYRAVLDDAPAAPEPAAVGQREIAVDIQTMQTSGGTYYYVRVRCDGRETTPYMFRQRYKAEYEAAHLAWIFGLRDEEPDVLAYDEASHPDTAETIQARTTSATGPQPAGGDGWCFDMEAAPKDGTPILVTRQSEKGPRFVEISAWRKDTFGKWHWALHGDYQRSWHPVVAWKPLDKAPSKPTPAVAGAEGGRR